jgi:hypothetical protein
MNKNLIIAISVLVLGGIGIASGAGFYFSINRAEVQARNACDAQLGNIENVLDNMWKNFSEIGGIADRERETAMEMFREYAEARTVEGQGAMMAWITEQVPTASPEIYKDLQARLTAGRQEYRGAQTYMLELVRAHTNIVEDPFRSMFISNATPYEFTVISSSATKEAVTTGADERVFTLPQRQ